MTWLFANDFLQAAAERQLTALNEFAGGDAFPKKDILMGKENGELVFKFALAGYSKDNLSVSFDDDVLTISGSKDDEAKGFEFLEKGIKMSKFERHYRIADKFDTAQSKVEFKDGMLTITIPVLPEKMPKKIKLL